MVEAVFSPLDLTKLKDMAKTVFDIAGGASGGTYLNEVGIGCSNAILVLRTVD